jgi:hypothetical protein
MKYLKVFETDTDQQNYITGEFDRPNITIVRHKKQTINYVPNVIDDEENDDIVEIGEFTFFVLYEGQQTSIRKFQFETGMTWADFYVSDFNGTFIDESMNPPKSAINNYLDNSVTHTTGGMREYSSGNLVLFGDEIINGVEYYTPF